MFTNCQFENLLSILFLSHLFWNLLLFATSNSLSSVPHIKPNVHNYFPFSLSSVPRIESTAYQLSEFFTSSSFGWWYWKFFFLLFITSTTQKMKFSIKDFSSKYEQIRRKLKKFTEEILNGKLLFLCSVDNR